MLPLLVYIWFQVLFTLLLRILFIFPLRYLFTISHWNVFRLRGWFPYLQTGLIFPYFTFVFFAFFYRAITFFGSFFQKIQFLLFSNESFLLHSFFPLSLATTYRISVDFFSLGYLDVSVSLVFSLFLRYDLFIIHFSLGYSQFTTFFKIHCDFSFF